MIKLVKRREDSKRDNKRPPVYSLDHYPNSDLWSTSQPRDTLAKSEKEEDSPLRKSRLLASTKSTPDLLVSLLTPEEPISPTSLSRETSRDLRSMLKNLSFSQEVEERSIRLDMEDLLILLRLLINVFRTLKRQFFQLKAESLLRRLRRSLRR